MGLGRGYSKKELRRIAAGPKRILRKMHDINNKTGTQINKKGDI